MIDPMTTGTSRLLGTSCTARTLKLNKYIYTQKGRGFRREEINPLPFASEREAKGRLWFAGYKNGGGKAGLSSTPSDTFKASLYSFKS
jgi:hypothetical protein